MAPPSLLSTTESAYFRLKIDNTMDNAVKDIERFLDNEVRAMLKPRLRCNQFNNYQSSMRDKSPKFASKYPDTALYYGTPSALSLQSQAPVNANLSIAFMFQGYKHYSKSTATQKRDRAPNDQFKAAKISQKKAPCFSSIVRGYKRSNVTTTGFPAQPSVYSVRNRKAEEQPHLGSVSIEEKGMMLAGISAENAFAASNAASVLPVSYPVLQQQNGVAGVLSPRAKLRLQKRKPQNTPLVKSVNFEVDDSMDLEQRMRRNYENRILVGPTPRSENQAPDTQGDALGPNAALLHYIQERRKSMEESQIFEQHKVRDEEYSQMVVDPKRQKLCNNLFNLIAGGGKTTTSDQISDFVAHNRLHYNCARDLVRLASEHPGKGIDIGLFSEYILKSLLMK